MRSDFHDLFPFFDRGGEEWHRYLNRHGSVVCLGLGSAMWSKESLLLGAICMILFGIWIGQAPKVPALEMLHRWGKGTPTQRAYRQVILDHTMPARIMFTRLAWFNGCLLFMFLGFCHAVQLFVPGPKIWW